ncbi:MAG: hypothetical protein AAF927_03385 [Bacteroidota bacterium]
MKTKLLLLCFVLLGNMLYGQEVLIQGNIATVEASFQPASTTAAFYKFKDSLNKEHIAAIPVNHLGQFRRTFPANTDVQLYIYYNEFVPVDTVINTGEGPVLSLRFMLMSKIMQFSAATAQADIESEKVRIIFHDAQMARLFQKAGFKEKYGFIFSYVPRPDSWEELRDISEYNAVMESYLDNLNPNGWRDRLYAEMDSLIEIRESFAGLDEASTEDDAAVFIEVPTQSAPAQPVESDVADVYAIPKEVAIDSEPVQSADSLDTSPVIYLAMEPKEPIKGFDLEENEEPEVRLPETSQVPAITTEAGPEIFIPIPKLEDKPAAPIASFEQETLETLEAELAAEEMEGSAAKSISGPSVSEAELIAPPIATVASDEDVEIQLPEVKAVVEGEQTAAEEQAAEEELVAAEDNDSLEELMALEVEPLLPEAEPKKIVTTEQEVKEASAPQQEIQTETDNFVLKSEVVVADTDSELAEAEPESSLEKIIAQTTKDPNLIPGIHIEALPMTPPPAREEEPSASVKAAYKGGSIVQYLDEMQSDALAQAVAESERIYGTEGQSSLPKSWRFPNNPLLKPEMEGRLVQNQEMFENYYVPRLKWQTEAPVAFMLRRIDKDPNYRSIEIIKHWSALHYEALIPELILRITYTEVVGLKNYKDIIIWDRVDSGDMVLNGPGAEIRDDLFAVAGRANFLLKNLTGEDFGDIGINTSAEERLFIRDQWVNWLLNLQNGHSFVSP